MWLHTVGMGPNRCRRVASRTIIWTKTRAKEKRRLDPVLQDLKGVAVFLDDDDHGDDFFTEVEPSAPQQYT